MASVVATLGSKFHFYGIGYQQGSISCSLKNKALKSATQQMHDTRSEAGFKKITYEQVAVKQKK